MKSSPLSSVTFESYCDPSVGLEVEAARRRGDALEHETRAARALAGRVVVDRAREQLVAAAAVAALEPRQAREQPGLAAQLGADLGGESEVRALPRPRALAP